MPLERFRGSSEIPLTPEGLQQTHELGMKFARKGGVDRILTSSLGRAVQTAQAIAKYTRAPITSISDSLHPWHLGGLEGQEVNPDNISLLNHLVDNAPDSALPGRGPISTADGESFNSFKNRVLAQYDQLMRDHRANPREKTAVITHFRNQKLLQAWLNRGAEQDHEIDPEEMKKDGERPGSVMKVSYEPHIGWQTHDVDLESPQGLSGGIYVVRHAKTPWNKESFQPMAGQVEPAE